MTFNQDCKYLDMNRMDSKVIYSKGLVGGGEVTKRIFYHPCLSKKNPDFWVSECPDDCSYFEPK